LKLPEKLIVGCIRDFRVIETVVAVVVVVDLFAEFGDAPADVGQGWRVYSGHDLPLGYLWGKPAKGDTGNDDAVTGRIILYRRVSLSPSLRVKTIIPKPQRENKDGPLFEITILAREKGRHRSRGALSLLDGRNS